MKIRRAQFEVFEKLYVSNKLNYLVDVLSQQSEFEKWDKQIFYKESTSILKMTKENNIHNIYNVLNIIIALLRKYGNKNVLQGKELEILFQKNIEEEIRMKFFFEHIYLNKSPY